jgi:hypothetical protein
VHRLADRFGIIRENGSVLEGSIRLIKLPTSKKPDRLLRDLDPSEYNTDETLSNAMHQTSIGEKGRKMKIMKRSDQVNKVNATPTLLKRAPNSRSSSSLTDKEKAYAEARARIFSDESGDNDERTHELSASHHSAITPAGSAPPQPPQAEPKDVSLQSSSSLENKALYRNRNEEAFDPDFQRGVLLRSAPPMYFPTQHHQAAGAAPAYYPAVQQQFQSQHAQSRSTPSLAPDAPVFYPSNKQRYHRSETS